MGKKPSFVEINGTKYDARNGRLLNHPRGPVIDGFLRKPRSGQIINKVAASGSVLVPAKTRLRQPAQTVHRHAQRSKTLMRGVVAKPDDSKQQSQEQKQPSKFRLSAAKPSRIAKALSMTKNSKVQRFGQPAASSIAPGSKTPRQQANPSTGIAPAGSAALAVSATPSIVRSVSQQRLERMLDEALLKADSHKKALKDHIRGKRRFRGQPSWLPRWVAMTVIALIVAGAGTYFAWQNIPYASMKLASLRAQIKGSVPSYVPSGFKFTGPTQYESGAVSMTFTAEEESRYFTLTQKASNWDSSSLEANALPKDAQVQTSQVKGTTVYYSDNQATWVSNGKRYTIKDHAQLNPGELFKIADSIL